MLSDPIDTEFAVRLRKQVEIEFQLNLGPRMIRILFLFLMKWIKRDGKRVDVEKDFPFSRRGCDTFQLNATRCFPQFEDVFPS